MEREGPVQSVMVEIDGLKLPGALGIPPGAIGVVIFAHGSGSSRLSPRNTYVAEVLRDGGIGTLLFDLLTPEEDQDYSRRFDIDVLSQRLIEATRWLRTQPAAISLPIGYFGASTGSAAALTAAAMQGEFIKAVVSRGGRPDMAEEVLPTIIAPTLLIVGADDDVVLELNRRAYAILRTTKRLEIIPGATHLFEEPGALERVARLATDWFTRYLG